VNRPSKKDIKAAVDKLKDNPVGGSTKPRETPGDLPDKKTKLRIRKQGI
jgi:hypothetical protein